MMEETSASGLKVLKPSLKLAIGRGDFGQTGSQAILDHELEDEIDIEGVGGPFAFRRSRVYRATFAIK